MPFPHNMVWFVLPSREKNVTSPLISSLDFLDWCNGLSATVVSRDSIVQIHCGVWANVNGAASGGKGNVLFEETVSYYDYKECGRFHVRPKRTLVHDFMFIANPRALVRARARIKMWVINKPDRKSGVWRKALSVIVYLNINDHSSVYETIFDHLQSNIKTVSLFSTKFAANKIHELINYLF